MTEENLPNPLEGGQLTEQGERLTEYSGPINPVQYLKGRGAQFNPKNRFLKNERVKEHIEAIDDWIEPNSETQYLEETAKGIVNKVDSPDVGMWYSMNPYQGCEHGCTYCYARNAHEYWGYSAGLDFERKIIVKKNAPELLRKFLMNPKWEPSVDFTERQHRLLSAYRTEIRDHPQAPGDLSGIQPAGGHHHEERRNPSGQGSAGEDGGKKLVSVLISITSFDEELRRVMEPRTTTGQQRIRTIRELSGSGVRMGVMLGPMIPLNAEHEMQRIMKSAAENGASFSAYTFIRLNGAIKLIFHDWLYKSFPDRADKVWHLIEASHDGKVNDSRWGVRMRGEGNIAQLVAQQYARYNKKYGLNAERWELDCSQFRRPGGQMKLF